METESQHEIKSLLKYLNEVQNSGFTYGRIKETEKIRVRAAVSGEVPWARRASLLRKGLPTNSSDSLKTGLLQAEYPTSTLGLRQGIQTASLPVLKTQALQGGVRKRRRRPESSGQLKPGTPLLSLRTGTTQPFPMEVSASTPSLTQYLDRPDVIQQIQMSGNSTQYNHNSVAAATEKRKSVLSSVLSDSEFSEDYDSDDRALLAASGYSLSHSDWAPETASQRPGSGPAPVKFPEMSMISPRLRRALRRLPPPTAKELERMNEVEDKLQRLQDGGVLQLGNASGGGLYESLERAKNQSVDQRMQSRKSATRQRIEHYNALMGVKKSPPMKKGPEKGEAHKPQQSRKPSPGTKQPQQKCASSHPRRKEIHLSSEKAAMPSQDVDAVREGDGNGKGAEMMVFKVEEANLGDQSAPPGLDDAGQNKQSTNINGNLGEGKQFPNVDGSKGNKESQKTDESIETSELTAEYTVASLGATVSVTSENSVEVQVERKSKKGPSDVGNDDRKKRKQKKPKASKKLPESKFHNKKDSSLAIPKFVDKVAGTFTTQLAEYGFSPPAQHAEGEDSSLDGQGQPHDRKLLRKLSQDRAQQLQTMHQNHHLQSAQHATQVVAEIERLRGMLGIEGSIQRRVSMAREDNAATLVADQTASPLRATLGQKSRSFRKSGLPGMAKMEAQDLKKLRREKKRLERKMRIERGESVDSTDSEQEEQERWHFALRTFTRVYHESMERNLRGRFYQWRHVTDYLAERAALVFQKVVVRFLSRREMEIRRDLLQTQRAREEKIREAMISRRMNAATQIQRIVKGRLGRKLATQTALEHRSAVCLQMTWRRTVANRLIQLLRDNFWEKHYAAVTIQRHFRAARARYRFRIMLRIRDVEFRKMMERLRQEGILDKFREEGAATRIQKRFRNWTQEKRMRLLIQLQRELKAGIIQKYFRRYRAQLLLARLRQEKLDRIARQEEAATTVEKHVRAFLARQVAEERRYVLRRDEYVRQLEKKHRLRPRQIKLKIPRLKKYMKDGELVSTFTIEPYTIDFVSIRKKYYLKKRQFDPSWKYRRHKFAKRIQRVYRGHRARRRVRKMKYKHGVQRAIDYGRRMQWAATTIQKAYRGAKDRQFVAGIRYERYVIKCQALIRGHITRVEVARLRSKHQAALTIQRYYRGHKAYISYIIKRDISRQYKKCAVLVQKIARGYIVTGQYEERVRNLRLRAEYRRGAKADLAACHERARLQLLVEAAYEGGHDQMGLVPELFRMFGSEKGTNRKPKTAQKSIRSKTPMTAESDDVREAPSRIEGSGFAKIIRESPNIIQRGFIENADVDLIFTKCKTKGENHLDYSQFIRALDMIAISKFSDEEGLNRKKRMIKMMDEHVSKAPKWGKKIKKAGKLHADWYLNQKSTKIQSICRAWAGRRQFREAWERREQERELELMGRSAIKVQSVVRKFLASKRATRRAQQVYQKFIDPGTGLPYWSNSRTGRTQWTKPLILKHKDVHKVTVVATRLTEFVVPCSHCEEVTAEVLCHQCGEVFCKKCYGELHAKGHRQEHVPSPIPMCMNCQYQMASRLCESCTTPKTPELKLCDVCFLADHDRHLFKFFLTVCVECKKYVGRVRCKGCGNDIYCLGCFDSLHKYGNKLYHDYEKLRYYTMDMRIADEVNKRTGAVVIDRRKKEAEAAIKEQKRQEAAALMLQRAFRKHYWGKIGRAHLKELRQLQRKRWRARKRDDLIRQKAWYKAADALGMAPYLRSDQLQDRVLKKVIPFKRNRARRFINENREDSAWWKERWGNRKGHPRQGFALGELGYEEHELIDQAKRGGVRLPGKVALRQAKKRIYTDTDITELIEPNDRLRIGKYYFIVDGPITSVSIKVDKMWRFDDIDNLILYKMPPRNNVEFVSKEASQFVITSQFVQWLMQCEVAFQRKLAVKLVKWSRVAKKGKHKRTANILMSVSSTRTKVARQRSLLLNPHQFGPDDEEEEGDLNNQDELLDKKELKATSAYLGGAAAWEEKEETMADGSVRKYWVNKETGDISYEEPEDLRIDKKIALESFAKAKKDLEEKKKKRAARSRRR